jgi:hypothetical protein
MDIEVVDMAYGTVAHVMGLGVGLVPSSVVADRAGDSAVRFWLGLRSLADTV